MNIKHRAKAWSKQYKKELKESALFFEKGEGDTWHFILDEKTGKDLNALGKGNDFSLFVLLFSAFSTLLKYLSGEEDVLGASPSLAEGKWFFLREDLDFNSEFKEVVLEVKKQVQDYMKNPWEGADFISCFPGREELFFKKIFLYENLQKQSASEEILKESDMTLSVKREGESFYAALTLKEGSEKAAETFALYFKNILKSVTENIAVPLQSLNLLPGEVKTELIRGFKEERAYNIETSPAKLFKEKAQEVPGKRALVHTGGEISYRELDEQTDNLAWKLKERGVQKGDIVGLITHRSPQMIQGILAILKAGAAYLPLDPSLPKERLNYMTEDSGAAFILGDPAAGYLPDGEFIDLTAPCEKAPEELVIPEDPDALAYVIYTSGSTGEPKGVEIINRTVLNLIHLMQRRNPLLEGDVYLFKTTFCFDVSVAEIFGWIPGGGSLALLPQGEEKSPKAIADSIARWGVTHINFVPSMLDYFIRHIETSGRERELTTLKYLMSAGEPISLDLIRRINGLKGAWVLDNLYGPTESTIYATGFVLNDYTEGALVPIGFPLDNISVYVLGPQNTLLPPGAPGELCLGGAGLARGYLKREELTKERFIDNPFIPGEKIYRTGDLVRLIPEGVQYLGRMDNQVKIRGFRIEPGEIEHALISLNEIERAAVVVLKNSSNEDLLAAYYTSEEDPDTAFLKKALKETLPDYMVPSLFHKVDIFPLNASGKIDKKALPDPFIVRSYTPPETPVQKSLCSLFERILGTEKVGITDNFFELGGHSLNATVLITKIREELSLDVDMNHFFDHPTVEETEKQARTVASLNPFIKGEEREFYPLTPQQRGFYILSQIDPVSCNIPFVFNLKGDETQLEEGFNALLKKYPVLTSSYKEIQGNPVMCLNPGRTLTLQREEVQAQDLSHKINEQITPFDLEKDLLVRATLLKSDNNESVLILDFHHIVCDGVSLDLLMEDLQRYFRGEQISESEFHYRDYALHVEENPVFSEEEKSFWETSFSEEISPLNLPVDFPRGREAQKGGASICFLLSKELMDSVLVFSRDQGVTPFMTMISVWFLLLYKYTGQEEIVTGTPVSGRTRSEISDIIGVFINTLALKTALTGEMTGKELLSQVKDFSLKALKYQNYPYENLVQNLRERGLSEEKLFDTMFSYQQTLFPLNLGEDLTLSVRDHSLNSSKYDLTLAVFESREGFSFNMEYNTSLFTEESVARIGAGYITLLQNFISGFETPVKEISPLSEKDLFMVLKEFNQSREEFPAHTVHREFELQAEKTPDAAALWYRGETLTYRELNERANRGAHKLLSLGVTPETLIGLYQKMSPDLIASLFAVLKAGCAYVPVDSTTPEERLNTILEDGKCGFLITDREDLTAPCASLNIHDFFTGSGENPVAVNTAPGHLAYVLYTSGSTGKPKGVMVEHRGVVSLAGWFNRAIDLKTNPRMLQMTKISFDVSVDEILCTLLNGASVFIPEDEIRLDKKALTDFIMEHEINIAEFVPSLLQDYIVDNRKMDSLRVVVTGAERLLPPLRDAVLERGYTLFNLYGPTEATVTSAFKKCDTTLDVIGKPVSNTEIYIVDKYLKPCPVGIPGELIIAGAGLARGYLGDEKMTEEKFICNPFIPGERMYRSGDLARWLPDGNLEFLGRMDNQVKIRGYRVEPGEIESRLTEHPAVQEACVLVHEVLGQNTLKGFIKVQGAVSLKEINAFLEETLPFYMVPSSLTVLDYMPVTKNGKYDRKALLGYSTEEKKEETVLAASEVEEKVSSLLKEILARETISVTGNFSEMGANSLHMIKLSSKLKEVFKRDVPMVKLFRYTSVRALSEYLRETEGVKDHPLSSVSAGTLSRDVAVIGMAGRFPGAKNITEFREILKEGKECISTFTKEELKAYGVEDSFIENPAFVPSKGVLENPDLFDSAFFGYSPKDATMMDPQVRLFHEICYHALETAGVSPQKERGEIGLFAGASSDSFWKNAILNSFDNPAEFYASDILADKDFMCTRVAYKLGLTGPAVSVQTACSTSLAAVDLACKSLFAGQCDIALAGGISLTPALAGGYFYQQGMITSPDGKCRPFDKDASGTVPGEGGGVVVLKPLEKALKDGDTVYCVIKGSGMNNDGSQKTGYTAPGIEGQVKAIEKAYREGGVSPDTLSYIEAHGTGTLLGDPVEMEGLKEAFSSEKRGFCAVGSVKGNIGHLDCGAGIAGLIKTVLSVKNREIYPSLNYKEANREIDFENSPFYVAADYKLREAEETPFRAGVSSFGIGGTNVHILLEESPSVEEKQEEEEEFFPVPLSAKTPEALSHMKKNLLAFVQKEKCSVRDISFTLCRGRNEYSHRYLALCRNREELISALSGHGEAGVSKEMKQKGNLWLQGGDFSWEPVINGRKIALPLYPFAGESFWFKKREKAPSAPVQEMKRQGSLEEVVTEVWEKGLGIKNASPDDDFFDLGGESLLAVDMITRVNSLLNIDLSPNTIVETGTLAELIVACEEELKEGGREKSLLVPLKKGENRPLFLVHPVGGTVYFYRELAELLEGAVYGIESRGLDGKETPLTDIPSMAKLYVEEIQKIQKEGPYRLGGSSFGGMVAFEMARILKKEGFQVEEILMMDTPSMETLPEKLTSNSEILAFYLTGEGDPEGFEKTVKHLNALSEEEQYCYFMKERGLTESLFQSENLEQVKRSIEIFRINSDSMYTYEPGILEGDILFFTPEITSPTIPEGSAKGWKKQIQGELHEYRVPGDHITMNFQPHVGKTAEKINKLITAGAQL